MTGQGRNVGSEGDGTPDDNVVKFRRGWYGPVEELVPVGPDGGDQRILTPEMASAPSTPAGGSDQELRDGSVQDSTTGAQLDAHAASPDPASPSIVSATPGRGGFWSDEAEEFHRPLPRPDRKRSWNRRTWLAAVGSVFLVAAVTASAVIGTGGRPAAGPRDPRPATSSGHPSAVEPTATIATRTQRSAVSRARSSRAGRAGPTRAPSSSPDSSPSVAPSAPSGTSSSLVSAGGTTTGVSPPGGGTSVPDHDTTRSGGLPGPAALAPAAP